MPPPRGGQSDFSRKSEVLLRIEGAWVRPLQVQSRSPGFGWGPPLQGDFVRRVVPRPAPTRGRGTSGLHTNAIRSDEIPLHRCPSRPWRSSLRRDISFGMPEPASTKPRTFRWRKTRRCGDRVQAGHGWPVLACWSQGWRNQAMRTIPAPPRLPPKATSPGALAQARSPHHRNAARSQWTPALFSLTGSASLTGEEPYSRPSWWARHSWVHTASMRFSAFGSRVIGRPHSRADSAGHLRVASRPSLEPRPDTGVAKSR